MLEPVALIALVLFRLRGVQRHARVVGVVWPIPIGGPGIDGSMIDGANRGVTLILGGLEGETGASRHVYAVLLAVGEVAVLALHGRPMVSRLAAAGGEALAHANVDEVRGAVIVDRMGVGE